MIGVVVLGLLGGPPRFTEVSIPAAEYQLYDLGVADIDSDGDLDIWTANHTAEQSFLLNDGAGNFATAAADFHPEMQRAFPQIADSDRSPPHRKGLCIWFEGRMLRFRVDGGALRTLVVTRLSDTEYRIENIEDDPGEESSLLVADQSPDGLALRPRLLGVPIHVSLKPGLLPLDQIWIGANGVHPPAHEFTLELKDRHGHAWADVNGDGLTDVFIARGGLRGEIENHPEIRDELLLRTVDGWRDVTIEAGLEKHGCRAREAAWIDFDGDGLLDLWIKGESSPNLLYRQVAGGEGGVPKFEEVGERMGLRATEDGETLWIDVESDGDPDLFLAGEEHLSLYRNVRERHRFEGSIVEMNSRSSGAGRSRFGSGRPTAGDFDADGHVDVFVASWHGSTALINDGTTLTVDFAGKVRVPSSCFAAAWVDADGDGDLDLHTVPDGLFLQDEAGRFAASGALPTELDDTVTEARTIWFDTDGDGDEDALIATIGRDRAQGHHVGKIKLFRNDGVE